MTVSKRAGALGIAWESTPYAAETTATYVLPCDSANIEATPVTYERVNSIGADPIGIQQSGFEYAWSFTNAEVSFEELGYILWLYMGAEANVLGTHTLSPTYSSETFTLFKDRGVDYGSAKPTQQLRGCRIDSLTIDQPHKGYAKVSASGIGVAATDIAASLTRAVNYGAVGYHHCTSALSGGVGYGLSESDPSALAFTAVKSFKIEMNRETARAGRNYGSNDPSGIVEGGRTIKYTLVADTQAGHAALAAYVSAAQSNVRVRTLFKWNDAANSQSMEIDIKTAQVTEPYESEIGTGTDVQETTITCTAFRFADANNLIDAVCVDGVDSTYESRVGA